MLPELPGELLAGGDVGTDGHEREDGLPAHRVVLADHRRLGDRRMVDERRLDLDGGDAVAGDVHHVVDAAEQPVVALLVALGAVAREVHAREAAPVGRLVALRVAVDAAQHGRPRPLEDQVAALTERQALAVGVHDIGRDAREREGGAPGLVSVTPGSGVMRIWPVSVCHQVSTMGQCSRPMLRWYHSHASGLMGSPTEPSSRSEDRSCAAGSASPCFMNARIAVGAI